MRSFPTRLWRHWYYGEWLPNTSYAKVGFTVSQLLRGYWYVRSFSDDCGGTPEEMKQHLRLRSENQIWALRAFHEQYEIVTVATGAPAPLEYFTFYCRKDTACGR